MHFDWNTIVFGSPLRSWALALGATIVFLLLLRLLKALLARRFSRLAKGSEEHGPALYIDTILRRTHFSLLTILGLSAGSLALSLPAGAAQWIQAIATIVFLVQVGVWSDGLLSLWLRRYQRQKFTGAAAEASTARTISFVMRLALYSLLVLMALDNLPGVDVSTLIAGVGIGGIAIALAVQNILADLFASISIALDKPFEVGDFIIVGEYMGTVEYVGLKTTRIRSLSGEQIVVSNQDLLGSRIRNYKRMRERRVVFGFGITYETPSEKVERAVEIVREVIGGRAETRFDRAHWKSFGPSSLDIEVVYSMLEPDYNLYMDVQQAINLEIHRRFGEEGIEFAYPTRTLFVRRGGGEGSKTPAGGDR